MGRTLFRLGTLLIAMAMFCASGTTAMAAEKGNSTFQDRCRIVFAEAGLEPRPVAVPYIFCGARRHLENIDRCHSLGSLDSATGGGRLAPLREPGGRSRLTVQAKEKKKAVPVGTTFSFLVAEAGLEPTTSGL